LNNGADDNGLLLLLLLFDEVTNEFIAVDEPPIVLLKSKIIK
jgi:hypothetical protein